MPDADVPPPPPVLTGETALPQPKVVKDAIKLGYVALGLSVLQGIVGYLAVPALRNSVVALSGMLITIAVAIAVNVTLLVQADKRKNWARLVLLVVFILGVLMTLPDFAPSSKTPSITKPISISVIAVEVVSLYFFFSEPATAWYKAVRRTR